MSIIGAYGASLIVAKIQLSAEAGDEANLTKKYRQLLSVCQEIRAQIEARFQELSPFLAPVVRLSQVDLAGYFDRNLISDFYP